MFGGWTKNPLAREEAQPHGHDAPLKMHRWASLAGAKHTTSNALHSHKCVCMRVTGANPHSRGLTAISIACLLSLYMCICDKQISGTSVRVTGKKHSWARYCDARDAWTGRSVTRRTVCDTDPLSPRRQWHVAPLRATDEAVRKVAAWAAPFVATLMIPTWSGTPVVCST